MQDQNGLCPIKPFPASSYSAGENSKTVEQSPKEERRSIQIAIPEISLLSGEGAIRKINAKFPINARNGTPAITIPIPSAPFNLDFTKVPTVNLRAGCFHYSITTCSQIFN